MLNRARGQGAIKILRCQKKLAGDGPLVIQDMITHTQRCKNLYAPEKDVWRVKGEAEEIRLYKKSYETMGSGVMGRLGIPCKSMAYGLQISRWCMTWRKHGPFQGKVKGIVFRSSMI